MLSNIQRCTPTLTSPRPPSSQYQLTQTKSHILIIWRRTCQEDKVVTFFSTSRCCPSFLLFYSTSCNYVWTVKFQYLISCDKIKTNVHTYNFNTGDLLVDHKITMFATFFYVVLRVAGVERKKIGQLHKRLEYWSWSAFSLLCCTVMKLQKAKPVAISGAAQLKAMSPRPLPPQQV